LCRPCPISDAPGRQQLDRLLDLTGEPRPDFILLAVREVPVSGTGTELMRGAKIDADAIRDAVHQLVPTPAHR
jgi:hypothetical protein